MVTKQEFEKAVELTGKIEKETDIALLRLGKLYYKYSEAGNLFDHELRSIKNVHFDCLSDDGKHVECYGDEYWNYGGHEAYNFSFTSDLLYDETAWEGKENIIREAKEERLKAIEVKNDKKEAAEKETYLRLREKFEGGMNT